MKKEIMILSEGHEGDRHVMTFEEAKQEVYDIALNVHSVEAKNYLKDFSHHTIVDYAKFQQCCFESLIEEGFPYVRYYGVTYSVLNDEAIENLWSELTDIPFNESGNDLVLSEDWFIFDKGTEREDIWHWFDKYHSKGIGYLLNDFEG